MLILIFFCYVIFTEQLNHAARHRNVYFDTVGGDPYGEKNINSNCVSLAALFFA